jgi:hypothetical protein
MSSPVVGEMLEANPGLEIAIASGCYFPQNSKFKLGKWVKVFSATDGSPLRTLETAACSASAPALADITGDGINEVILPINGHRAIGGDGTGDVQAWEVASGTKLWNWIPRYQNRNDDYLGEHRGAVIADIDGNGSLEVLVANAGSIAIADAITGTQLTCATNQCGDDEVVLGLNGNIANTPAVGDLDGDGDLEIVASGNHRNATAAVGSSGMIFVWTDLASVLTSSPGTLPSYSAPWPQWRGSAERRGG